MKVTHRQLVENHEIRERYKDFLTEQTANLIEEQYEKSERIGAKDYNGYICWLGLLPVMHNLRILGILDKHETDENLLSILEAEQEFTDEMEEKSTNELFTSGFVAAKLHYAEFKDGGIEQKLKENK